MLVYGGTASGVAAALAASRMGCSTVLIERGDHFGGMTASGLGSIDTLRDGAYGGIFYEFLSRVREYYFETYGKQSEQYRLTYGGYFMEAHVAENILKQMIGEEKRLRAVKRHQLTRVLKSDGTVVASVYLDRDSGREVGISHTVAIDATYEGDFLAAAGAGYRLGREGRKEFGERFAGVIFHDWRSHRQEILPESSGEPSDKLQANCFRVTLSDDSSTRIPFTRPASYSDFYPHYRYLANDFETGRVRFVREVLWLNPLANRKWCLNGHIEALTSPDFAGLSMQWAKGDWDARDKLFKQYRDYTEGLLYFLQNDPALPKVAREEAGVFGLPPDEYISEGNFPWQLYVRQARRLIGEYLITEHDSIPPADRERPKIHKDSIAVYEHSFDSHACRNRDEPGALMRAKDGFELIEGVIWFRNKNTRQTVSAPATIPFRAIVPETVDGLLASCALSATNVAFSALRMESAWMSTGHAAGVAAAMSVSQNARVRSIDTRRAAENPRRSGPGPRLLQGPFTRRPKFRRPPIAGGRGRLSKL